MNKSIIAEFMAGASMPVRGLVRAVATGMLCVLLAAGSTQALSRDEWDCSKSHRISLPSCAEWSKRKYKYIVRNKCDYTFRIIADIRNHPDREHTLKPGQEVRERLCKSRWFCDVVRMSVRSVKRCIAFDDPDHWKY